jgi:hypothetical protein
MKLLRFFLAEIYRGYKYVEKERDYEGREKIQRK